MDDLGHPPDSERLRVGFAHAMDLIADGTASAVMVVAVLRGRKVRLWASGEDDVRETMEDVLRKTLGALTSGDAEVSTGRDAAHD